MAASLALTALAAGYGTINSSTLGQMAEHERMTRAALTCASGSTGPGCFEAASIEQLAGRGGTFGAVGEPDRPPPADFRAHCDDADYLHVPGYPQSRALATTILMECIIKLRGDFGRSATQAGAILFPDRDVIDPAQVDLTTGDCAGRSGTDARAKCRAILAFGQALHGTQDFYSHSNWADEADPGRPIGITNPPGLGNAGPAPFLDLRSGSAFVSVPRDLSTGCFHIRSDFIDTDFPGSPCRRQIRHRFMNKDGGTIDPSTGAAFSPVKPRGMVASNFALSVGAAIADTRVQWQSMRDELVHRYGATRGNLIACAIERDDPVRDCQGRDIAIVIDSSGSNQDTDPSNLRIAAGIQFNESLVTRDEAGPEGRPDRSAVVDFDTSARVVSPLDDPSVASFAGIDSEGGTNIGSGVDLAIDELTRDGNTVEDRAGIVVLTDGMDNEPGALVTALNRAGSLGIRVSFGFLSPPPVPIGPRRGVTAAQSAAEQPREVQEAILATGGVFSTINSAEAQNEFVSLVNRTGAANLNDGNGSDDDGGLSPGLAVTGRIADAADTDRFTYEAPAGRRLVATLRPVDGQALTLRGTSVGDLRALGAAVPAPDGTGLVLSTSTRRAGTVTFTVAGEDGATGLYQIGLEANGEDVRGTAARDNLACPAALDPTVAPPPAYVLGLGGPDRIVCGPAADVLVGGKAADRIRAGAGDDTILVGRGDPRRGVERITGGAGTDLVEIAARRKRVRRRGGARAVVLGRRSSLRLRGVERIRFTRPPRVPKGEIPPPGTPGSHGHEEEGG